MESKAYDYIQTGFEKFLEKFEKAGLLLVDKENFPDLNKAITSLQNEAAK